MEKILLIVGIISAIACVLFLLFAVVNLIGYYHLLDGAAALYDRLQRRMISFFVIGIVLGILGIVSFIIRSKI